jgi:hypothetical protein
VQVLLNLHRITIGTFGLPRMGGITGIFPAQDRIPCIIKVILARRCLI